MADVKIVGVPDDGHASVEVKFHEDGTTTVHVMVRTDPNRPEKLQAHAVFNILVGALSTCGVFMEKMPIARRPELGVLEGAVRFARLPEYVPCPVWTLSFILPALLSAWGWTVDLESVCPRVDDRRIQCQKHRMGGADAAGANG